MFASVWVSASSQVLRFDATGGQERLVVSFNLGSNGNIPRTVVICAELFFPYETFFNGVKIKAQFFKIDWFGFEEFTHMIIIALLTT
jgi:hypothetical protein